MANSTEIGHFYGTSVGFNRFGKDTRYKKVMWAKRDKNKAFRNRTFTCSVEKDM